MLTFLLIRFIIIDVLNKYTYIFILFILLFFIASVSTKIKYNKLTCNVVTIAK